MLNLKGINLGRRQQELNEEVIKTTSQNVDFNLIKELEEKSDVDRFFKIDVASVYKDINYIVETLKCGDSLYITRALKCAWLFEDAYSAIVNPDYLHHEVFPFMSIKMKKKLLTTVSMHIKNEKRAEDFYKYCLTDNKLNNIAAKFLIWTSEHHKMEIILKNNNLDVEKLKFIIGNSFILAEAYLAKEKKECRNTNGIVHELRYLMNISNERYLDLMEKYTDIDTQSYYGPRVPKLGLRLSKEIITKHKERISNNIHLYFKKLNIDMVAKHSSIENIKKYTIALLPATAQEFWSMDFYKCYKKILNILPQTEVYMFLRDIFLSKYSNELFEMSKTFYDLNYYELLTSKDKEIWALEQLKQNKELLGPDNDYLWYQFVNYDLAFKEIKKCIAVSTDPYTRTAMVNVLIDTVKSEEELEKLLRYYYERHVNESEDYKLSFIDNVVEKNNIFKLGDSCWDAFNKILYSTSIFSAGSYNYGCNKYKTVIILYHIVHNKAIPQLLEDYVLTNSNAKNIIYEKDNIFKKITDEQIKQVYQKFIDLCVEQLKYFDTQIYESIKDRARNTIDFALLLMEIFKKTKGDCPDIILKYVKLDSAYYEGHQFFVEKKEKITQGKLFRLLKLDTKLLLQKLEVSDCFSKVRINNLLKKIKIYFLSDVKDWLSYCEEMLEKRKFYEFALFDAIVVAIFHLGSDDYKIAFVSKYAPKEAKISHDTIDRKFLRIQEGICRFAHYSRPPVPLEYILPYIKGDYVHYCLPMFNSYLANLPMPQCITFITAILNKPVSVQKHGLRLAFQCFSVDDLTNLIVNVWKSTKNVSLRLTIFKALCDKMKNLEENSQRKLYEVLKMLTLDLNENDDDIVFDLVRNFKLVQFKADLLKTAWITVQNLSEQRSKNIQRKCAIVQEIESEISTIDKEFCHTQIIDEFVRLMLTEEKVFKTSPNTDIISLNEAKWSLTAKYIIYIDNDQLERSLGLVQYIIQRCTEMWNLTENGYYSSRKFLFWFVDKILVFSYHKPNKVESIPVLECIIKTLTDLLPKSQIYTLYIKLNFIILLKKVLGSNKYDYQNLVPEKVAKAVAAEVVVFLNELKVKNLMYGSFYSEIGLSLCEAIDTACFDTNLNNVEIVKTLVSSNLIEYQLQEVQLLALCILPRERPEEIQDIWLNVIRKIQSGNNLELQAYIHEFFVHTNFKEI